MSVVIGLLQALTRDDCWIDDSTDRLTRRYIVAVVAIQLLVVYGGGFLRGNPIQCFTPKYFTPPQVRRRDFLYHDDDDDIGGIFVKNTRNINRQATTKDRQNRPTNILPHIQK